MEKRASISRLTPHPAKFFCDFSVPAGLPSLRSGVALRATRPRLHYKIAKKLGLTINAKNSNLTTAPSIGFRYSLKAFAGGQKTGRTSLYDM